MSFITPKVYNKTIAINATYGAGNIIHLSGNRNFVQIQNQSSTHTLYVKLNGDSAAILTLDPSTTQVFNPGDCSITSLDFANTDSGTGSIAVQVVAGIGS